MKKTLCLCVLLLTFSLAGFAQNYMELVKNTYLENTEYTVEQIVDVLSCGAPLWVQSGRNVVVYLFPLEYANEKNAVPLKLGFYITNSKQVLYTQGFPSTSWEMVVKKSRPLLVQQQKIYEVVQQLNYGDALNYNDFCSMFKSVWDRMNPSENNDCEFVDNGSNVFVRVKIPYGNGVWEYVNPQRKSGSYDVPEVWGKDSGYNHFDYNSNLYAKNSRCYDYDRRKYNDFYTNIYANSRSKAWQSYEYFPSILEYFSVDAENCGSEFGFHVDLGFYTFMRYMILQTYVGCDYRKYDGEYSHRLGLDFGARLGIFLGTNDLKLVALGGIEFCWIYWDKSFNLYYVDLGFNYVLQIGVSIMYKNFFVEGYRNFCISKQNDNTFSVGVGWLY